jgi:hypothetical protein
MFGSIFSWPRRQNHPIAGRVWNRLDIPARQKILEEEGFSNEHIQRLRFKRWKKLSELERIWLATPLSLDGITRSDILHHRRGTLSGLDLRGILNLFSNRSR